MQTERSDEMTKKISWSDAQMELANEYMENDMRKLRNICDPIIRKKNVPNSEYDDLISKGMMGLIESIDKFDPAKGVKFSTYFTGNIKRKFCTWTRDHMTDGRCNYLIDKGKDKIYETDANGNKTPIILQPVSLDYQMEDGLSISEVIPDINNHDEPELSENVERYLNSLTGLERNIADLIMDGFNPKEIQERLHIDEKRYKLIIKRMGSFEKRCIIARKDYEEDAIMNNKTDITTREKCKKESITMESVRKKMTNKTWLFNHPLQRESNQWTTIQIGNLVSDMLQGNPIPPLYLAEQNKDGRGLTWCVDGKQRCTNSMYFLTNKIKVSKKIRRYMIQYLDNKKDENGEIITDEFDVPITEVKEFDIRNCYFKDLPEPLQEKFLDFSFDYILYLNCSDEDIAYHIERTNDGKPMNGKQKGLIKLGELFAARIKGLANTECFRNRCALTKHSDTNGDGNRAVVESIMTTTFLDDWNKEFGRMCDFIKNNATLETFYNFDDLVIRLTDAIDDKQEIWDMFTQKDTAIWFGVFGRFVHIGKDDKRFVEFMAEFAQSLHSKKIDFHNELVAWDDLLEKKNTKDKATVIEKVEFLTQLMYEYFKVSETETKELSDLEFVQKAVLPDATDDDIEEYNDYLDGVLPMDSNLAVHCRQALLAIAAYAYSQDRDVELSDWLTRYNLVSENAAFSRNQMENYRDMMKSFMSKAA